MYIYICVCVWYCMVLFAICYIYMRKCAHVKFQASCFFWVQNVASLLQSSQKHAQFFATSLKPNDQEAVAQHCKSRKKCRRKARAAQYRLHWEGSWTGLTFIITTQWEGPKSKHSVSHLHQLIDQGRLWMHHEGVNGHPCCWGKSCPVHHHLTGTITWSLNGDFICFQGDLTGCHGI